MTLLDDARQVGRVLRREPAYALITGLMLALGLGASTTMFTVVNSVLLRPLPFDDAAKLVAVVSVTATGGHPAIALPDFQALRDGNRTLAALGAYYRRGTNLTGTDQPERLQALVVSADFFAVLRIRPALGRLFVKGDEVWGSHRVALLSDGTWRS